MVVNFAFYIHEPSAVQGMATLVSQLQKFNVKCAVLASPALSGLPNVQIIPDIKSAEYQIAQNNLRVLISDLTIDNFVNSVAIVQYWPASNELYYNKRFKVPQDLDKFMIEILKTKSFMPTAYIQNNSTFLYMYDTDNVNPLILEQSRTISGSTVIEPSVNISWNFTNSDTLIKKWTHLTETLSLTNSPQTKYDVVINSPSAQLRSNNLIYFCMEPYGETTYKQFLDVIQNTSHVNKIIVGTHKNHLNNAEWHLKASLGELKRMKITKTHNKVLSVVVSDKDWDPGHKYRLALIKFLDAQKNRGYDLHIYGRCQKLKFKNYKGELPDQEKDDALYAYKYHLNVENHYIDNYITEKLYDPLAAECLCFYKGAPNVSKYFSEDSFVQLSGDVEKDAALIKDTILQGAYEKKLETIREAKGDLLWVYGFEPRVLSLLTMNGMSAHVSSEEMKAHLTEQGFQRVEIEKDLPKILEKSIREDIPVFIQQSTKKHTHMIDTLSFGLARARKNKEGITDAVLLRQQENEFDMLVYPSGAERILRNLHQHVSLLSGVKFEIAV